MATAFLAYAVDDVIHEVLGHGGACLLLGVRMIGVSTIGLQTREVNLWVAAAGSGANTLVGLLGALALGRRPSFSLPTYFAWLFAFVNLMNGTGYLMASALTNFGDWAVIVARREPAWAWRGAMGVVGIVLYAASVRWGRGILTSWVATGEVSRGEIARLTYVPYLAGGFMFVAASIFNPVGPGLIFASGAGASFGLTFGLLLVNAGQYPPPEADSAPRALTLNWAWTALGFGAALVFVAVLGPGIRF